MKIKARKITEKSRDLESIELLCSDSMWKEFEKDGFIFYLDDQMIGDKRSSLDMILSELDTCKYEIIPSESLLNGDVSYKVGSGKVFVSSELEIGSIVYMFFNEEAKKYLESL